MVPEIRARPMYYAAAACAPPRSHSPAMPAREGWRYGSPPARSDDLEHPLDWAMKSLRLQRSASLWVMYGRFFSGSGAAGACQPQPAFCSPFIQRSARPARRPGASSHFSFAIHRSRRLSQRYLRPFTKCCSLFRISSRQRLSSSAAYWSSGTAQIFIICVAALNPESDKKRMSKALEQIATLKSHGFVVIRALADAARCAEIRRAARAQLLAKAAPLEYEADLHYPGAPASRRAGGGETVRRLLNAYDRDRVFRCWAAWPSIVDWMQMYFGEPVMLTKAHHNCIMTKHPVYGSLTGWHRDARYWSFKRNNLISAWLALESETVRIESRCPPIVLITPNSSTLARNIIQRWRRCFKPLSCLRWARAMRFSFTAILCMRLARISAIKSNTLWRSLITAAAIRLYRARVPLQCLKWRSRRQMTRHAVLKIGAQIIFLFQTDKKAHQRAAVRPGIAFRREFIRRDKTMRASPTEADLEKRQAFDKSVGLRLCEGGVENH